MSTPSDADLDTLLTALSRTARQLSPLAYYPVSGEDNEVQRVAARAVIREWLVMVAPESQR